MKTITHDCYIGEYEYDPEAGIFHGRVTNMDQVVTFQAETEEGLKKAMEDSVECCLEFCCECGLEV
jgi:predicted HicB family RNase H-like nuclease